MKKNVQDALDRLAAAEAQFLRHSFLAPVLAGQRVQVCIAGVRCQLHVEPPEFSGWGVFQPLSHAQARLQRPASLRERHEYLRMFPAVQMILVRGDGVHWQAIPAQAADRRFKIEGAVPVRLCEEVALFDSVIARFDGRQFWFDGLDERSDAVAALYLRQALAAGEEPAQIARKGLTRQQEQAYLLNYAARLEAQLADERARGEYRLRDALAHAGAELRDYVERQDVYRVTYVVDGRAHTSVINKHDLTVHSAGVCLSGRDQNFDLASLVGVLREGAEEHELRFMH